MSEASPFETHWWSKKTGEDCRRPFHREDFAIRHGEDMSAWGYNVDVTNEAGKLLFKSRTEKVTVWYVGREGCSDPTCCSPERRFTGRPKDMYQFGPIHDHRANLFDTEEEAKIWHARAANSDYKVFSHEMMKDE